MTAQKTKPQKIILIAITAMFVFAGCARKAVKHDGAKMDLSSKPAILEALEAQFEIKQETEDEVLSSLYSHYAMAGFYEEEKQYDKAIAEYLKVLEIKPAFAEALTKLGHVYTKTGNINKAREMFEMAVTVSPDYGPAYLFLSTFQAKEKNIDKAIESLEKAAKFDPDNFSVYWLHGNLLSDEQKYSEAIIQFEKASTIQPDNPAPYIQLGRMYVKLDDFQPAINAYTSAINLYPNRLDLYFILAEIYENLNQFDQALEQYQAVLALSPTNSQAVKNIAKIYLEKKDYGKATNIYLKVLKERPQDQASLFAIADIYQKQGNYQLAREYYEKLIQIEYFSDMSIKTYVVLGEVYDKLEVLEEKIKDMTKHIQENPHDFGAKFLLAEMYERSDDYNSAIEHFEEIVSKEAFLSNSFLRINSYIHLGYSYGRVGKQKEAIAILEKAASFSPRNSGLFFFLGLAYNRAERYLDAVEALEESISLDDTNAEVFFFLGEAYENLSQKYAQSAIKQFQKAILLNSRKAEAYNYLGYLWAERGTRLEEALEMIQKALSLDPQNGYFLDSLGWVYYKLGEYEKALPYLLDASQKVENDPVIYDHLGDVYLRLKEWNKAKDAWEKSLEFKPTQRDIKLKLQKLPGL